MIDFALKRVSPDVVEGLAIPYGVDTDGEQFTPDTDLCLDWFPGGKSGRPVLYDHGLEAPGPSVIGRQTEYEERPDGRWAQAQLIKNHQYRKAVDRLVEEGALGFSSGAMAHLATFNKRTRAITRWPWVELSLTPIPAHPGAMVHAVKSADAFRHMEEAEVDMTAFLKSALGAVLSDDRNASPDPDSLDDKAGRVSAAVDEFRDHARAAAEMRTKAGRVLSASNRERIAKALASKEAVLTAYGDLEALLAETDPEAAAKSADLLWSQFLAFQAMEARLRGVEVPSL
jgi:N-acyl-D-aspartate/D-glutamate deacylase